MLHERPEFQVIGEASDVCPVCLSFGGIQAAQQICAVAPGSTILFVSEEHSSTVRQDALQVGARTCGYILK